MVMGPYLAPGSPEANLVYHTVMAALSSDPLRHLRLLNTEQKQVLQKVAVELSGQSQNRGGHKTSADDWIGTVEVARRLGVSQRTVIRKASVLGGIEVGGRWFFSPERINKKVE
ncbi:hypothetical protein [Streptomyces sp. NPDC020747]|uniref:hypothetical protein n=1 Tax=Streptomyces sp. NPDC020747 TaxID=3365086 RepID=UPI0037B14C7A